MAHIRSLEMAIVDDTLLPTKVPYLQCPSVFYCFWNRARCWSKIEKCYYPTVFGAELELHQDLRCEKKRHPARLLDNGCESQMDTKPNHILRCAYAMHKRCAVKKIDWKVSTALCHHIQRTLSYLLLLALINDIWETTTTLACVDKLAVKAAAAAGGSAFELWLTAGLVPWNWKRTHQPHRRVSCYLTTILDWS